MSSARDWGGKSRNNETTAYNAGGSVLLSYAPASDMVWITHGASYGRAQIIACHDEHLNHHGMRWKSYPTIVSPHTFKTQQSAWRQLWTPIPHPLYPILTQDTHWNKFVVHPRLILDRDNVKSCHIHFVIIVLKTKLRTEHTAYSTWEWNSFIVMQ